MGERHHRQFFFHPDWGNLKNILSLHQQIFCCVFNKLYFSLAFTVGTGIAPVQRLRARGLLPPVGNHTPP